MNYEILKKYGINAYRKQIKYDIAFPYKDEYGLIVIPTSSGLDKNEYNWSIDFYIKRYKRYLYKAIKTGTICHFWFHPSMNQWFLNKVLPELINYISKD